MSGCRRKSQASDPARHKVGLRTAGRTVTDELSLWLSVLPSACLPYCPQKGVL